MGRNVQTAGVAPTDDGFTVIAPGPEDIDQDGPALIGDPDMGFGNLRQFGPTLIHHTQLKVRKNVASSNFMPVDSPGMIGFSSHLRKWIEDMTLRVWSSTFADRADVALLFPDPDNQERQERPCLFFYTLLVVWITSYRLS